METRELLTALWPLIAFQILLILTALVSIARRGETKHLPKIGWIIIVIVVSIFGPIAYFMFGKGELKENEQYRD
ncbi:PLDc N-terminal domain-containing protein [Dethiobacter alkaliphilus]|uniref:PLDc N-terminal domain-containing protein n=1 Tax=Dethiobacter alkaliphilus TaxID=427926 RepID=UPI0022278005|nr:PLDc N-terminal domain-containing protein [Dethiobacter alkaliphilus]MCW3491582.1 PLDc N-terminal domain-containing protein [Dethiobacter alkaliphilus]